MELSVLERVCLLDILPKQGSVKTVRLAAEIRKAVQFSDAEREAIGMSSDGGTVKWDATKARPLHVDLLSNHCELVKDVLAEIDSAKAMREDLLPLWDLFVGSE